MNNSFLKKTAATLCLFSSLSAQSEVLIRNENISPQVYSAVLQTRTSATSLVEHEEEIYPSDASITHLMRILKHAQADFLKGNETEARRSFWEMTSLAQTQDWHEPQRHAIFYAYLRLAQLTSNEPEKMKIVEDAASFAPDLKPDASLFAPPLVALWKQTLESILRKSTRIAIDEKFAGYDILKVDGLSYHMNKVTQISIAPGMHRLSLLSNSRPYFSQQMTATQLNLFRVDSKPLAFGDCAEPGLLQFKELNLSMVSVLYSDSCVRTYSGTTWIKGENPLQDIGVKDVAGALPSGLSTTGLSAPPPSHKWLWIGVAAAAVASAALIYRHQQDQQASNNPEPVHRQGY
jgi:hypothetical protein